MNMFKQLVAKSDVLQKKYGVKVFKDEGKTQTRDVEDILVETIGKTKGNLPALQKIFDIRGIAAVSSLISLFNQTRGREMAPFGAEITPEQEAAATATAMAALRSEIEGAISAQNAREEIDRDLATAQKATSASLTTAWEKVVAAVSDEFTPTLIDTTAKLAEFIGETDFSGLIRGFTAVAEAAGLAVEGLTALGIIKKKPKTPEQLIREGEREKRKAESEEKAFLVQQEGGARALRRADVREKFMKIVTRREAAEAKIRKARASIFAEPEKVGVAAGAELLGRGEFVQQLSAAGVGRGEAADIAEAIVQDPTSAGRLARGTVDLSTALFDPQALGLIVGGGTTRTEEQQRLIQEFAMSRTAQQTLLQAPQEPGAEGGGGAALQVEGANAGLQSLTDSLQSASAAARSFGPTASTPLPSMSDPDMLSWCRDM